MTNNNRLPLIPHILVIDDVEDDLELAKMALKQIKTEYRVTTCQHGREALDILNDPSIPYPDLILLDWKMPRMSGLDVLKILKAPNSKHKHIPVCIFTTSTSPIDIAQAYENYANVYIEKPINFSDLITLLNHSSLYWLQTATLLPKNKL
ncbi:MAG: response regulator [Crinalium sp.]